MEDVRIAGLWVLFGDGGAGEMMRPGLLLYAKMDGVMAMWLTFGWLVVRTYHEYG